MAHSSTSWVLWKKVFDITSTMQNKEEITSNPRVACEFVSHAKENSL